MLGKCLLLTAGKKQSEVEVTITAAKRICNVLGHLLGHLVWDLGPGPIQTCLTSCNESRTLRKCLLLTASKKPLK